MRNEDEYMEVPHDCMYGKYLARKADNRFARNFIILVALVYAAWHYSEKPVNVDSKEATVISYGYCPDEERACRELKYGDDAHNYGWQPKG